MKNLLSFLMTLSFWVCTAQQTPEESVEGAIRNFFEAFHAQDSASLRALVSPEIRMQTIGRSSSGEDSVRTVPFGNFLRSISSIPDSVNFEERLRSVYVMVDGSLAQAWTPYEFWIDGQLSHCGVNAFHLFRDAGTWKILYIIDTRRREGCSQ